VEGGVAENDGGRRVEDEGSEEYTGYYCRSHSHILDPYTQEASSLFIMTGRKLPGPFDITS
jgi:hypothetical protein